MRVLITGAGGVLGRALVAVLERSHEVTAATHPDLDITDAAAVTTRLRMLRPQWVVHLAAATDVDRCQREPAWAFAVNAAPCARLVELCSEIDAGLLLASSLAVFDGRKPSAYSEADTPGPINVYGASKLQAEQTVARLPRHLIVRTGWIVEGSAADRKFVGRILALAAERDVLNVVSDRFGSPTYVHDLAGGIARALDAGIEGLIHLVNSGPPVSRFELARRVIASAGLATEVRPVASDAFPDLAPRPAMEAGYSDRTAWLRPWPEALDVCLRERLSS
jgi:dTDP-4-dehydrorhamnose reductase